MDVKELFQALEFAHYAERFRDSIFVVALPGQSSVHDLLLDLKVLGGYRIRVVLVAPDPDFQLEEIVRVSNHRGTRFHLSMITEALYQPGGGEPGFDIDRLRTVLEAGRTPIVAYHAEETGGDEAEAGGAFPLAPTYTLAARVAVHLGAHKLFLVGPAAGALREPLARTHFAMDDLGALGEDLAAKGLGRYEGLLAWVRELLEEGLPNVILLEGEPAHLFREVFTHEGAGILFYSGRHTQIRRAAVGDTTDIALLIKPEVEAGRILTIEDAEIEANIHHYWVYEVDGLLVAAARFKNYGPWAEMAQFSTLPRYRGKGRAKELALRMMAEAGEANTEAVFALSVDPRMWEFFRSLGFEETGRDSLPEEWRAQYDFSRPSHAFLKEL